MDLSIFVALDHPAPLLEWYAQFRVKQVKFLGTSPESGKFMKFFPELPTDVQNAGISGVWSGYCKARTSGIMFT